MTQPSFADVAYMGEGGDPYYYRNWRRAKRLREKVVTYPCPFCGGRVLQAGEYHERCIEAKKRLSQRLSKTDSQTEGSQNAKKPNREE